MVTRMSRGEMIRRLDEAATQVHDRLGNGPLTPHERLPRATPLERLLPMVADELQGLEDSLAAAALFRSHERRADADPRPHGTGSPVSTWLVQVGYPIPVQGAAPNGWVTAAVSDDMREAGRQAAFVYPNRVHPDGGHVNRVRIRSEEQILAEEGGRAARAALHSLRDSAELYG